MSRFVSKITDSLSLQWSLWTKPLTFQTPHLTVLFGPNADLEEVVELPGIASGPPVLFPGPGVGAKALPVGNWADPDAMVVGEVGDPVQCVL